MVLQKVDLAPKDQVKEIMVEVTPVFSTITSPGGGGGGGGGGTGKWI